MCTRLSILLLLSLVFSVSSTAQHRNRRVLHQPLFPRISVPPVQAPSSSPQTQPKPQQQQPKLPFSSSSSSPSSSSPQKPFFPSYHTPPFPPSPTVLATFPANISSLLLPRPNSRNHHPAAAIAVSLSLLSLAILAAAAAFALHRRLNSHTASSPAAADDDKASKSDSLRLFPPNTATSDGDDRKPRGKSSPRSELLYLGTVGGSVDARGDEDSSCSGNCGFKQPYRKLGDSPELNPLPPLPRHNFRGWTSGEYNEERKKEEDEEEEEDEQFFSPRGSSGNKQQSPPSSPAALAASSSRSLKVFHFDKFGSRRFDKLGSRSFTSRTPSYPRSNSLSSSVSPSHSLNLSPGSVKSLPPQNPASPSFSSSVSSPKPREDLGSSWDVSGQGKNSPTTKLPPPPPPPPPRFWETPVVGRLGEASQNVNVGVKNENEETPKPKLKALHWDKVKASSDRAMVWDRLRSSSFQ